MEETVRKIIAFALGVAVQGAAVTGRLVHVHPDEGATAHHGGRVVHAHWPGHPHHADPLGVSAVHADDGDRAVFLNPFVAVPTSLMSPVGVVHGAFELPVATERQAHRGIDVVRSHDPPFVTGLSARAPPPFLS